MTSRITWRQISAMMVGNPRRLHLQ